MTCKIAGGCSPRFRASLVATLAGLIFTGCFSGADVGTIYCVTNDNCPAGYICADSSKPGGCKKKSDVTPDSGAFDTAASNDTTSSPDGARSVDAVSLLDSGSDGTTDVRIDSAPGSVDISLVVDGPAADAPADIPQFLPDSSDSYVADAPTDPPPPVGGMDGNAGAGGTVGSDGATGGAGTCGSRDCTSNKDNDCNGTADNQETPCKTCILGNSQACSTGIPGICAAGSQACQLAADHQSVGWGTCVQNVAKHSRDCMSSSDNDCNGTADNAESTYCQCPAGSAPRSCSTGLSGICSAGSQACVVSADKSSSAWGTCTQVTAKGTETCANPGTDDNCDGIVDNVPVASCNVGTGFGACANGGNTACSGTTLVCNPVDPGIGDPSAWHLTAAPNGSWDWDCDGGVTKEYPDTTPPFPVCTGLDINACSAQPVVIYAMSGPIACGQTGDVGSSYCYWLSLASACEPKTSPPASKQQGCR
jgi:hypothetical protein